MSSAPDGREGNPGGGALLEREHDDNGERHGKQADEEPQAALPNPQILKSSNP